MVLDGEVWRRGCVEAEFSIAKSGGERGSLSIETVSYKSLRGPKRLY